MALSLHHGFPEPHNRAVSAARFADASDFLAPQEFALCPDYRFEPAPGQVAPANRDPSSARFVRECAERLIAPDYDQPLFAHWVETRADLSVADLLPNLLTLAARHLGEMWNEDLCSFVDVTLGMHRLTLILVDLEPPHADPSARAQHGGRILLAPAPGDQHGFGLALVGFYLRRAGWDVRVDIAGRSADPSDVVAERDYDIVGFSVGHERAVAPVAQLIAEIRQRSRNPRVRVVVGGPFLLGRPEVAMEMGADLCADDAAELVQRIEPFIPPI